MAARLRKRHQDDVREKIRASQLVNYLQDHALTNSGAENANTRVRAATTLLNKIVADEHKHEHTGADGGPLEIIHRVQ